MNRLLVYLLTLTLLVGAACSPVARPTPEEAQPTLATGNWLNSTPAPTAALPTPDVSRLLSERLEAGEASQDDHAIQELVLWARDASGLRTALGPQADEILELADEVETAAAQDMLRQLESRSKPKGMPAPLPPHRRDSIYPAELEGLMVLFRALLLAPSRLEAPQNGNTNPVTSSGEFDQAVGENAQAHAKITSTVTGSKMEAQVEMTIRAEKDGKVYEEKASGKISVDICPDAEGNVPMDLTLQTQASASAEGYGLQFADHVIGHVNDDADLSSIDHQVQSEISITKGKNWITGAPDTSFVQVNISFTMDGLASRDPDKVSITGATASVPRSSLFVSPEQAKKTTTTGVKLAQAAAFVFADAQRKWQNGYCVAVAVREGEEQRVMKGSETPFTATVRHKFEGKELPLPVIAKLTRGKVSVIPSGIKVQAPATFRYKAPDEAGGEGATVELVTRSRRGIAKLEILIRTSEQYYTVNTAWAGSTIELTGTICAFDKPFTLKLGGHKPGGMPYVGKVQFIPKDATSGSWMATGTYGGGYAGTTNDSGGSTYQVTGLADDKTVIALSEFTQKGVYALAPEANALMHAPPIVMTYHWPGMQIPLVSEIGACSSD